MLRAERDTLQRQQASLSPEALNKKGREFQQKVNNLDLDVQSKRQALEKSNSDALSKIQGTMLKIIADIAKERKANLVFQRTDLVLFDQVVRRDRRGLAEARRADADAERQFCRAGAAALPAGSRLQPLPPLPP